MWPPTGLIPWFSKTEGILTLLCCITLSSSRENQRSAQEVARRISGAVAEKIYANSRHTKYPSQLLSFALHYLPFVSRFPLPHFTLAVLFTLSFPISFSFSFSFSVCLFLACLFVFPCVGLLVCRDGSRYYQIV